MTDMDNAPPPLTESDDEQCARIYPSGARCQRTVNHPGECNPVPWRHPDLDARGAQLRAELDRLDLAREAARADALTALTSAATHHHQAGDALDDAVAEARAYGATWQQIADATGMARPSAWKRWSDRG